MFVIRSKQKITNCLDQKQMKSTDESDDIQSINLIIHFLKMVFVIQSNQKNYQWLRSETNEKRGRER